MGSFLFARHGETEPNARGLRCGGDQDAPLTARGIEQAAALGAALEGRSVGVIVTGPLRRTVATADAVSRALGGVAVHIEPLFVERRLGEWNGKTIAETEPLIAAGQTPPGGESEGEFRARIDLALQALRPFMDRGPLVISSKGVARVLGLRLGGVARPAGNAELLEFSLPEPP